MGDANFEVANLAGLQALANEALRWVTAASVTMARPTGILLVMPVFTRAQFGTPIRAGLAFGLALPILGYGRDNLAQALAGAVPDLAIVCLALISAKELFVGALIGFLLGIPVWSIQAAGELIDTQRGITSETGATDPSTRSQASAFAVFLGLLATTLLVAAGGLDTLVDALYRSYGLWPIRNYMPSVDLDAMMGLAKTLDRLLRIAVVVAGPVLALLLLLDVSVMLIGRFSSQLNLNDLAPTLKNVCAMLFLVAYTSYLFDFVGGEVGRTRVIAARLGEFLR